MITEGGYNPKEVQNYVNAFCEDKKELLWAMADYIWRGFAGSGEQRKNILSRTGHYNYYSMVQEYVQLIDKVESALGIPALGDIGPYAGATA